MGKTVPMKPKPKNIVPEKRGFFFLACLIDFGYLHRFFQSEKYSSSAVISFFVDY